MPKKGRLFLVDGDNHVYEGLSGIADTRKNDFIQVYVTQSGLSDRLAKKYGDKVHIKEVTPGDQAVDNVIKSRLGSETANNRYSEVVVLSQDKGYKGQIDKAHKKGKNSYRQAKSIKQAINKR